MNFKQRVGRDDQYSSSYTYDDDYEDGSDEINCDSPADRRFFPDDSSPIIGGGFLNDDEPPAAAPAAVAAAAA